MLACENNSVISSLIMFDFFGNLNAYVFLYNQYNFTQYESGELQESQRV